MASTVTRTVRRAAGPARSAPGAGLPTDPATELPEPVKPAGKGIASDLADRGGAAGALATVLTWAGFLTVPLVLTYNDTYRAVFPEAWCRDSWDPTGWPGPLGLSLGLLAVAVGMTFVLLYHRLRLWGLVGELVPIQVVGAPNYAFSEGVVTHIAQPEGFALLGGYLIGTWMFNLMPPSYYNFTGGIVWWQVAAQLLCQDLVQYTMHRVEHSLSAEVYKASHKPHHRFTNPRIFDAFNGSAADTILMILVPLLVTANVVHCNVWTYMAFGSLYANWLTLIHSEYPHPWDAMFRRAGLGTAADHHVHHKLFKYNFGHLFMYWDSICGTYRDPKDVRVFNRGV